MKLINKIEGVKEIAAYNSHLNYIDDKNNFILNDVILQEKYGFIGTFEYGYLKYGIGGKEQAILYDLATKKEHLLPEKVGINLIGEHFPESHAYTYSFFPRENKTLYKHYTFSLKKNSLVKELSIDEEYAFISSYKGDTIFVKYSGRPISSVRFFKGPNYELLWEHSFSSIEKLGDEVYVYYYIGAGNNVLIFSTNNGWLVGLDVTTGNELWVLKGIPEAQPEPNEKNKDFGFSDTSKIKLDDQRGVLYCFLWNIYWEWDIMTQQVVKLCHNFQKAQKEHYTYLGLNYFMEGDTIYYADGGTLLEHEGRINWPRLIAVNKITGDIICQLEFKPKTKKEKEILTWKDFQYSDNKFYLLDNNQVLWIVEK